MEQAPIVGTVKYVNRQRGYGFIAVPGTGDFHFGPAAVEDDPPPERGDCVVLVEGRDGQGRRDAVRVKVVYRAFILAGRQRYFGRPTKLKDVEQDTSSLGLGVGAAAGFALAGPAGSVAALVASFIGAAVGQAIQGEGYEAWLKEGALLVESCPRCNGTAHVSSLTKERIAYQCERCGWYVNTQNTKPILPDEVELAIPRFDSAPFDERRRKVMRSSLAQRDGKNPP